MKNSFPIEIRKKSALVKIVYTPRHGKPWFTVIHHDAGGQRQRKVLRQLDDAREFAEATATALSNGALSVLPLSGAARYKPPQIAARPAAPGEANQAVR